MRCSSMSHVTSLTRVVLPSLIKVNPDLIPCFSGTPNKILIASDVDTWQSDFLPLQCGKVIKVVAEEIQTVIPQLPDIGIPVVFVSALEGKGRIAIIRQVMETYEKWCLRLSTARLNRWICKIAEARCTMNHAEVVIAKRAVEEGRGLVVIVNKMDLLIGKENAKLYEKVIKVVLEEIQTVIPQIQEFQLYLYRH